MANSSNNGTSNNNFITKALTYLLAFYIALAPTYLYANAATGFGGWSIGAVAASAGQATINATKNIGGQVVKSYAQVAPTAGALAKNIARVGGVMAVSVAIQALLGGVDYVLDPANNRVIYYEKQIIPSDALFYIYPQAKSANPTTACQMAIPIMDADNSEGTKYKFLRLGFNANNRAACIIESTSKYGYTYPPSAIELVVEGNPNVENKEKYLPYDTVAAEIARRAAAGDPAANDFVGDTANPNNWDDSGANAYPIPKPPIVQQLDANAGADAPPDVNNPPDVPDPSAPFKLPAFCSWASFICNAMITSNNNSGRAASASEQNVQKSTEIATTATAIQGEIVKGNNKTDELKGEVVNNGTKIDNNTTVIQGELVNNGTKIDNNTTVIQGELVNNGTKIEEGTTTIQGELVNLGSTITDAISELVISIGELISPAIDSIVEAITGVKTEVTATKDAVDDNTAENTRIGDQAHDDSVAEKEATEDQTAKDELHREWQKDAPTTPEDGGVPIIPIPLEIDNPNINFGSQCPAPYSTSVGIMGNAVPLEFSYQPLCSFMVMLKPFVVATAYILGAYIIGGVGRGGATDG